MNIEDFTNNFFSSIDTRYSARTQQYVNHEKYITGLWGWPLRCFEVLTEDLFDFISEKFRDIREESTVEYAIATILGKSLLRINEILTLLWKGYPGGSMALSRSLHELTVCLLFIIKHRANPELASRYFKFRIIEIGSDLVALKETCLQMGWKFEKNEELANNMRSQDELVNEYGNAFKRNFGWCSCVPGIKDFSDMEKDVGSNALRAFYRLGNKIIHSNPESNRYSLGIKDLHDNSIYIGPFIQGFDIPASYALLSMSAMVNGLSDYLGDDASKSYIDTLNKIMLEITIEFKKASRNSREATNLVAQDK